MKLHNYNSQQVCVDCGIKKSDVDQCSDKECLPTVILKLLQALDRIEHAILSLEATVERIDRNR